MAPRAHTADRPAAEVRPAVEAGPPLDARILGAGTDPAPAGDAAAGERPAAGARVSTTGALLVRFAIHVGALVPLTALLWDAATGGLSYDPVRDLTQRTGRTAFVLLVLSLAVRPAIAATGISGLRPLARIFGLYAFAYATAHLLVFVGLDFGFRWDLIVGGVLEKRYAVLGLAAFLILLVLAATSTKGWVRRLGPLWRRLHRAVYSAAVLATAHYLLAVKTITRTQLAYAVLVGLLLLARSPEVEERLLRLPWRRRAFEAADATAGGDGAAETDGAKDGAGTPGELV